MTKSSVRQAVVLCAGHAKRLGDLTADKPKAMLPIAGRPLIAHIIEKMLSDSGFEEVVLVVGHQGDLLKELFAQESRVKLCQQTLPEGTARALLAAEELLQQRFLVTYGDLWVAAADYDQLRKQAENVDLCHVAVNQTSRPLGAAVYLEGDKITGLVEKPLWKGEPDTCWNAAGLYVLNWDILQDCRTVNRSTRGEFELTEALQRAIEQGAPFVSYIMSEAQIDLGTPERYQALCESLSKPSSSSDPTLVTNPLAAPMPLGE